MFQNHKLVSGVTFIKNGITLGYPIRESIQSIDPLCDEVVINVGYDDLNLEKDDGTYELLRDTFKGDRYVFFKSHWDPKLREQGLILSQQTNLALDRCQGKYAQYIQGDEAVHEDDLAIIKEGISGLEKRPELEGLVFQYLHFYGNVDIVREARTTYRREVRLIRNVQKIRSWKDAQGFRHSDASKLLCLMTTARIFHYGWARESQVMTKKVEVMDKLFHPDEKVEHSFQYERVWGLKKFQGAHPAIMQGWIEQNRNNLDILNLPMKFQWKHVREFLSMAIEKITGYRVGEFKNYILDR